MNILNIIREQLSPELLGQVGQRVGETPEATRSALDQSVQALLGSAAAKASSPEGATSVFNLLKEKTPQEGWPTSATGWLGNLMGGGGGIGSSLVSLLLGSKTNMIRDFIASRSGVRGESATAMLGTAGSLLMGILGKHVATQGLNTSSFGQLIRSQVPNLQGHFSPDLASMLGVGNLFSPTKPANPPAAYANQPQHNEPLDPVVRAGASPAGRILRFALIPIALLLGLLFFMNRHSRTASVGGTSDESFTTARTATAVSNTLEMARVETATLTDKFKSAIAGRDGGSVDLTGLTFDDAGTIASNTKGAVSALGKLMSENASLKASITAYGKTADEASSRANSIKSALLRIGITGDRISVQPEIGESVPKVSFVK